MNQNEVRLRSMELKLDWLIENFQNFEEKNHLNLKMNEIQSEWVTLEEACKLLGCISLKTMRCQPNWQPLCGVATAKIGIRKAWTRAEVEEWLTAMASKKTREAYLAKYDKGGKKKNA